MKVFELIKELEKIEDKSLEVYIHSYTDVFTSFLDIKTYVDGVVIKI